MKKLASFSGLILIFLNCYSQREAFNWYFGENAGLDFNNGNPIVLTNGALFSYDNSSTISDSAGNLLFYTYGVTVWNKNHAVMANGNGLTGNTSGGQSALIVNQPFSNIYFIFTTDNAAGSNGLRYSTVDISLNGGLGGVVQKNILLFSPTTEKLDAFYNCSDNSFWIISHKWNSDQFNVYKLSINGLDTIAITSNIGSVHSGGIPSGYNAMGQMTLSPDGMKLVCGILSMGNFEIFDFNVNTGLITNPIILSGYQNAWGAAFSPDSKILYITTLFDTEVVQFDLSSGVQSVIASSSTIVGNVTGPGTNGYYVGYLQLAPGDKLYAAVFDDTYLAVINNPNGLGSSCNFIDNGLYLGGKKSQAGLSRAAARNFYLSANIQSQNFCFGEQTNFSVSASSTVSGFLWDFADPASGPANSSNLVNPVHSFSSPGNYQVQLIITGNCGSDTINHSVDIFSVPSVSISGNALFCDGDSIALTAAGGNFYQWSNGSGSASTTITGSGTYSVTVSNSGNCSASDSVEVITKPSKQTNKSVTICSGDSIFLQGNYQITDGIYYDSLLTFEGCDSIITTGLYIMGSDSSLFNTSICAGDSIFLQGVYQTTSGKYYDTVATMLGCDSIIISNLTVLEDSSSKFIFICQGDSALIHGTWQSSGGSYTGAYISGLGCDSVVTVNLVINYPYNDSNFTFICSGDSIFLAGNWQKQSGVFFENFQNTAGCDSIIVTSLSVNLPYFDSTVYSLCYGDSIFLHGSYHTETGTFYDTLISQQGCDSIIISALSISALDTVGIFTTICSEDSIFLQGSYQTDAGIYYDTLSNSEECDSVIKTILTVQNPEYDTTSITICPGDSVFLAGNYQSDSGTYPDTLSSANGCDSVVITNLGIQQEAFAAFSYTTASCSFLVNFFNQSIGADKFKWDFGNGYGDTISNPSNNYSSAGSFSVFLITDPDGCADTAMEIVNLPPLPIADFSTIDLCKRSSAFLFAGSGISSLFWDFGDGSTDTTGNPSHNFLQDGDYNIKLVVLDENGCTDTASKTINVIRAEADFFYSANPCSYEVFFFDSSRNAGSFFWDFGDGNSGSSINPGHLYQSGLQYDVTLIINKETTCPDSVTKIINLDDAGIFGIYVPNAFSPNGDGLNDFFKIQNLNACSGYRLMIFDRWGELIFKSENAEEAWDGFYKGRVAPLGIYAYVLTFNKILTTGHVAIIK